MLFGFLASERALTTGSWGVGRHGVWTGKIISFPDGKVLSKPKLPIGRFYQATDPGFILLRSFGRYARLDPHATRSALAEISTGKVILSDGALDVFGRSYAAEHVIGKEVGLYEIGKGLHSSVGARHESGKVSCGARLSSRRWAARFLTDHAVQKPGGRLKAWPHAF